MATKGKPDRHRIQLRVSRSAKALIERAVHVSGLTVADLVCEGARGVLGERGGIVLTGAPKSRAKALRALEALAKPLPAGFTFDREEANERRATVKRRR